MRETGNGGHLFKIFDQHLLLLPQKAIYWKEKETLIVADVHFGKVGHFRKAGIAIPKALEQEDLAMLSDLLNQLKPKALIFLGDLFHSELNSDWQWLELWRDLYKNIKMTLVLGNHDVLDAVHYLNAKFKVVNRLEYGPFLFTHEPSDAKGENSLYNIAGHIHPGVKLRGKGRSNLTLSCFYFSSNAAILPAFGKFTGHFRVECSQEDKIFGILHDKVICL